MSAARHAFAAALLLAALSPFGSAAALPELQAFSAGDVRLDIPKGWRGEKDKKAKSNNWVFTPARGQHAGSTLHVMLGAYQADVHASFQALLDGLLKGAPGDPRVIARTSAPDGASDAATVEYAGGQVRQVLHASAAREQNLSVVVVYNGTTQDADALGARELVAAVAASAKRDGGDSDQARAHEQTKAIVSPSDSVVLIEKVRPREQNANLARGAPVSDAGAIVGKWAVGEAHSTMDIREATFDAITGNSSYEFAANGTYVYVFEKTLINPPFSSGLQMTENGRYRLADSVLRLDPERADGWVYNLNSNKQPIKENNPPARSYEVRAFSNGILLSGGCSKYQMDFDAHCKSGKQLDFPLRPAQ